MTAQVAARVLDFGLRALTNECSHVTLCESEPTSYALASIGNANCKGYGLVAFSEPSDHSINGRYVASSAITSGTKATSGSVSWIAAVDGVNGRLLTSKNWETFRKTFPTTERI